MLKMRLYFVSTSWWSVMDFDRTSGMTEIKNKEKSFLRFFENVQRIHLEVSLSKLSSFVVFVKGVGNIRGAFLLRDLMR